MLLQGMISTSRRKTQPGARDPGPFTQVRLTVRPPNFGDVNNTAIRQFLLFEDIEGTNYAPTFVSAIASTSNPGSPVEAMLDENQIGQWAFNQVNADQVATIDFGAGNPRYVRSFGLRGANDFPQTNPHSIQLEGFDANGVWQNIIFLQNMPSMSVIDLSRIPTTGRMWRALWLTVPGPRYSSLAQIEFLRGGNIGIDLPAGGVPVAGMAYRYQTDPNPGSPEPLEAAFDGKPATIWSQDARAGWIGYAFADGFDCDAIAITSRPVYSIDGGRYAGDQTPVSIIAQYSDDGGLTWAEAWRDSRLLAFTESERYVFRKVKPPPLYVRLTFGPAQGDPYLGFAELEFLDTNFVNRSRMAREYAVSSELQGYEFQKAIDLRIDTDYASQFGGGYSGVTVTLTLERTEAYTLNRLGITARGNVGASTPVSILYEESEDGQTYRTMGQFQNYAPFGNGERRIFTLTRP